MMTRFLMTLFAALAMTVSVGTLTGCNTVEGAGEDIEEGGEELTEASREVQQEF